MPRAKKQPDNIFKDKDIKAETTSANTGYSEEQENHDLVELGILSIEDFAIHDPTESVAFTADDVFSTIDEQKKMISIWKNQIALISDRSKLKRAKMILKLIENGIENISDDEVQMRMKDSLNTAFDQKMYVDSIIALSKEMTNLLRLDSINENGDAGTLAIQLTTASGTEIKIADKVSVIKWQE